MWKAVIIVFSLTGCAVYDRAPVDDFYTKADVDAINAENLCRNQARNLVQIAKCNPPKR